MRRVALFGASFDPPTGESGHGGIVRYLSNLFPEVWLVPVYQHPFASKRQRVQHTGYDARLEMLKLQFASMSNVVIQDAEREFYKLRERQGLQGDSLIFGTYDLIEHLRKKHVDCVFHLVLGGDTLNDLQNGKWRRGDELLKTTPVFAIRRKGVLIEDVDVSKFKMGLTIHEVPGLDDVSSTEVRRRLLAGETADHLLDAKVTRYILENRLYGKI